MGTVIGLGEQQIQGHVALLCPSPTVTSVSVTAVIIIAASIFSGFCHGSGNGLNTFQIGKQQILAQLYKTGTETVTLLQMGTLRLRQGQAFAHSSK